NSYLSVSKQFNFDGTNEYYNKNGENIINNSLDGRTAKECFFLYDSQGQISPCREPKRLKMLLKTKGSVNLHIKMYAEDRARGYLPLIEFKQICIDINAPSWFFEAVENQKPKYYPI